MVYVVCCLNFINVLLSICALNGVGWFLFVVWSARASSKEEVVLQFVGLWDEVERVGHLEDFSWAVGSHQIRPLVANPSNQSKSICCVISSLGRLVE